MNLTLLETIAALREIKKQSGVSNYDEAQRVINRERVNVDRGKKEYYTWAQIKRAYKRQRGVCPVCTHDMPLVREKLHGDHWACNLTVEQGLNAEKNCMATHKKCNQMKATMTPAELSKLRQLNPTMGSEEESEMVIDAGDVI